MKPFSVFKTLLVSSLLLFATVSCEKENLVEADPEIVTLDATEVSLLSASVSAQFTLPASVSPESVEMGVFFSTGKNPLASDTKYKAEKLDGNKFTIHIPNLNPATTYYYRGFIIKNGTYYYGEVKNFTTIDTKAIIFTGDYDSATRTATATMKCDGFEDQVQEVGICYNYKANPTEKNSKVFVTTCPKDGKLSRELKNIPFGTVHYRAYIKVMGLYFYGEDKSFEGNSLKSFSDINMDDYSVTVNLAFANGYKGLGMGVCFSKHIKTPTTGDSKTYTSVIDSVNNCFTVKLKNIPCGKVYYRPFVSLGDQTIYGDVRSFDKPMKIGQPIDLGLSVMWADIDLGADNPDESGSYYAWGETDDKEAYTRENYKWAKTVVDSEGYTSYFLTKYLRSTDYAASYDDVDGKAALDPEDDAATANWGSGWRTPSFDEANELFANITLEYFDENGSKYFKLTSVINGNSIILPACMYMYGSALQTPQAPSSTSTYWYEEGLFMLRDLGDYDSSNRVMLFEKYYEEYEDEIYDEVYCGISSGSRGYYGFAVRPVFVE